MNWTAPKDAPHIPQILSVDAICELRLIGLYPNAADLLVTLDAVMTDRDNLLRITHDYEARARTDDAYAVALQRAAEIALIDRDNGVNRDWVWDDLRAALAKNPNPSGKPETATPAQPDGLALQPEGAGPDNVLTGLKQEKK